MRGAAAGFAVYQRHISKNHPMDTAKVFWSGRSQAVRLPKEYRLDTDQVGIRREGRRIVLEPMPKDWAWLDKLEGSFDEDFIAAANEEVPLPPDRPEIDEFF